MIVPAAQRAALREWFDSVLPNGVMVIWAHQDGPRPPRPYVTLQIGAPLEIGHDEEGSPEDGALVVTGDRELTTFLQAFGGTGEMGPLELLGLVLAKLSTPTAREALEATGLAWVDLLQASDVPEVQGTRWEHRATMDLRWRTRTEVVDEPGQIDAVVIAANVDGWESEQTVEI